jgi:hypothetical protein
MLALSRVQIGIDSQCLSYVIDAFAGISPPTDALAIQKLALVRLFFYLPGTLWVTPTVTVECAGIRNVDRAELHESFIRVLFGEMPLRDSSSVNSRTEFLKQHHTGENDCSIVAEAEDVGHSVLLSFDSTLVRRLTPYTTVKLTEPYQYWEELSLPRGAKADKVPHFTNPLLSENWWRW